MVDLPYSLTENPAFNGHYALWDGGSVDMVVKILGTYDTGEYWGVAAKMDAETNPQNGLIAYYSDHDGTYCKVKLDKIVGGVTTNLINTWTNVNGSGYPQSGSGRQPVASSWLEIRVDGTSVSLWQFDIQVGTTQTVSEAAITAGTWFGVYSTTGASTLSSFYACERLTDYVIGWAGSSNTYNNTTGYRYVVNNYIKVNYPQYDLEALNIAQNGWSTFPNLVNIGDLSAAEVIIFDQSNDDETDTPEVEALLRLAYANGQRVIAVLNPSWTATTDDQVNTPYNLTALTKTKRLLDAYGASYVDVLIITQNHVNAGGHITDLWADTAHLNATGYGLAATGILCYLPNYGEIQLPRERVYAAAADFEYTPVIRAGTDYDSRTGSGWVDDGAAVYSTTPDDTITFTDTFRKFGAYRVDAGLNDTLVSIDGGAFTNIQVYANGYDIGTNAEHTIIIKVVSNCYIDEFWAIGDPPAAIPRKPAFFRKYFQLYMRAELKP